MISIGNFQFHIENIPYYIVLPFSYIILIIIGYILDQNPSLKMQTPSYKYKYNEPECGIFKNISHDINENKIILNFIFLTKFQVSKDNCFRMIRIRLSNKKMKSIYRSSDFKSNITKNLIIIFEPDIFGKINIEIFCINNLIYSFQTNIRSNLSLDYSIILNKSNFTNICINNNIFQFFSNHLITFKNYYQDLFNINRKSIKLRMSSSINIINYLYFTTDFDLLNLIYFIYYQFKYNSLFLLSLDYNNYLSFLNLYSPGNFLSIKNNFCFKFFNIFKIKNNLTFDDYLFIRNKLPFNECKNNIISFSNNNLINFNNSKFIEFNLINFYYSKYIIYEENININYLILSSKCSIFLINNNIKNISILKKLNLNFINLSHFI